MNRKSMIAIAVAGLAAAVSTFAYVQAHGPDDGPAMNQLALGEAAPSFRGTHADGSAFTMASLRGRPIVIEWNNPGCPSVQAHYSSGNMQKTQAAALAGGAAWLTVNSGAEGKQGHMNAGQARAYVVEQGSRTMSYVLDPTGVLGRAFGATATPHVYILDAGGKLVYRGAVDDKPSGEITGARNHVLAALGELKAGKPVSVPTSQPYGCNVKYKA